MEQEILESEIPMHANIPLVLSSYIDIFSSFDPRPFSEKALSDDFLIECKRAARDKSDLGIELVLAIPKDKRNINDEFKIKKRLRDHFHKHFLEKENELKKMKKEGIIWVIIGIIINIIVVSSLINFESALLHSVLSIFEVPSWFLIWEGLGKILLDSRKLEPDFRFYKKMANCEINFKSY
jgi:hypothetical protein